MCVRRRLSSSSFYTILIPLSILSGHIDKLQDLGFIVFRSGRRRPSAPQIDALVAYVDGNHDGAITFPAPGDPQGAIGCWN